MSRAVRLFAIALLAAIPATPALVRAQSTTQGGAQTQGGQLMGDSGQPMMGSMSSSTLEPLTFTNLNGQPKDSGGPKYETGVSFIDSAVPMTQVRLLFDANYDDRRPTRDDLYFSGNGWSKVERSVDWQELTGYFEFAYQNLFSGFFQVPLRWVDPEANENNFGLGDVTLGCKLTLLQSTFITTAFQLKATIPTRTGQGLSSDVYSIEPGFLFLFKPWAGLTFEGEARYWAALSDSEFAGDFMRYGVGVTFLERSYDDFWATPVLELVGWSILSGKEVVALPDGYGVRNAGGETIVNAMAGVRFGFGDNGDIYTGLGHSLTDEAWAQLFWRVEFRVRF